MTIDVIAALMSDLRSVDCGYKSQTEREIDALVMAEKVKRTADALGFWVQQLRTARGNDEMTRHALACWSRAYDMHEEAKAGR